MTSSRSAPPACFGLSLPQLLQLEARAAPKSDGRHAQGQRRHHGLAGRRPRHHRHVGPQARSPGRHPRRVQADRHQAAGVADQRTPAEDGRSRWTRPPSSARWPTPSRRTVPATVFMTTGNKPTPAIQYPALGSLVTQLLPAEPGVPPYVSLQRTAQRLGRARPATSAPPTTRSSSKARRRHGSGKGGGNLRVRGIHAADRLHAGRAGKPRQAAARLRRQLPGKLDKSADLVDGLRRLPQAGAGNPAFRQDQEGLQPGSGERGDCATRYGTTPFGQGALAARRLVEAGVRFVTVSLGGWDTHGKNFEALQDQLAAAGSIRRCRP